MPSRRSPSSLTTDARTRLLPRRPPGSCPRRSGIVARHDLLHVFLHPEAEIRESVIRESVIREVLERGLRSVSGGIDVFRPTHPYDDSRFGNGTSVPRGAANDRPRVTVRGGPPRLRSPSTAREGVLRQCQDGRPSTPTGPAVKDGDPRRTRPGKAAG
ncbi:hypothetical protein [Streptomyces sp. NPDC048142]|uniref:hypothetical protein n=1 Tax=Streptomyces sp. NPDC048142 TaxID=3365501 RepID=UPI00371CF4EF